MDKLKMQSPNLVDANITKIAELFPNCITEDRDENGIVKRVVDFDLLRQELSANLVEGPQERYTLSWPGKNEAILTANAPIAKTLRPCEEESVDFENTKNIYIEGDNLDVLKLLQETYLNKVMVIYIDQPYNTGNDFIYKDDFAEDTETFLKRSNQKDEEGNRLVANTEANGRFHSDWLSMMYPRLKQARNLLRADGVIFISIDDNEVMNLRKLCDEVFGEGNYCGQVTVLCNPKGRSQDKYLATCHEYLLIYSKTPLPKGTLSVPKSIDEIASDYPLKDKRGVYRELELRNTHREFGKHNRKNLYYPFYVSPNGKIDLIQKADAVSVMPDWDDGFEGCWTWGKEKSQSQIQDLVAKTVKNNWKIYRKGYASDPEDDDVPRKQLKSIWLDKKYHTEKGQAVFNDLFGVKEKIFQAPKSTDVLADCIAMCQNKEGIILDIFSGSATTAHATMQLNAEDNGNRKFIMVQLSEPCDEKSEAFKAGYKTIAEIGKERIRRAGKKIKEESPMTTQNLDIGFRVFKVDTSNMKDVYYTPDEMKQDNLELFKDHIKPDRRPEDLLFQVFLDWGLDLALPIAKETIDDKTVFVVDTNALLACFDSGITEALVKKLAKYKPVRVVFRDDAFGSDSIKINVEQIFKLLSPGTEVKSI
jgi:adenine-specific DNA-methyltransferase